jgi:hypothetical protein
MDRFDATLSRVEKHPALPHRSASQQANVEAYCPRDALGSAGWSRECKEVLREHSSRLVRPNNLASFKLNSCIGDLNTLIISLPYFRK